MFAKQISISVMTVIFIGSGLASAQLETGRMASSTTSRIDFDQIFADAENAGRHVSMPAAADISVNRAQKSDRLLAGVASMAKVIEVRRNDRVSPAAQLLHCESVAPRYADPSLSQIIGRCFA